MATRTTGGNAAFHNFHNDYAHIADPNERRRLALAEIDKAPFGYVSPGYNPYHETCVVMYVRHKLTYIHRWNRWYHVRAIIVAGIGFFTVCYMRRGCGVEIRV